MCLQNRTFPFSLLLLIPTTALLFISLQHKMSESESGTKRVASEENIKETQIEPNKKQKLGNEITSAETTLPALSTTLVLDKAQEDTLNQLVQGSVATVVAEGKCDVHVVNIALYRCSSRSKLVCFYVNYDSRTYSYRK